MNIVEEIFRRADPLTPAILGTEGPMTFRELDDATARVVQDLARQGLPRTPARIALCCPDGRHYVILALGILRAGHCLVPVAKELTETERRDLLATTAAHALLESVESDEFTCSSLRNSDEPEPPFSEPLRTLNPAFIRFSSGTTGTRKGVVISHETLRERITAANAGLRITPQDRVLWLLPMAHHFAVSLVLYLYHGAATVLPASHLAEDVLTAAIAERATVFYASPFHYRLLAGEPSGRAWPTLRLAVSSAAALDSPTGVAFRSRFGVPVRQGLGIIEVGLPVLNTCDPFSHPESVGHPQPAFSLDLRDPNGQSVPIGETGELFLRGPGIFDAYLQPWRPRAEVLEDDWFRTGDLAVLDEEGFLTLQGRTGSVLNVGGMKCFPEEVEEVLLQHPAVAECRVVARPHPQFGQVPAAEIVVVPGVEIPPRKELLNHCRTQLSAYKVPVEFRIIDRIPRTPSGKILRS